MSEIEIVAPVVDSVEEMLTDIVEIRTTLRDVQPSHYIFKIECFSLLVETKFENYESDVCEAGGYKWKLSFYPNGNLKRNGKDHISLYLVILDTENLPCGWEVIVNFKLFVYDHIRDKYLTMEDAQVRSFNVMKTEWGFDKFLSLEKFQNPSNGYLIDDTCLFGAEVFVIESVSKGECLSMTKILTNKVYTWKVDKLSSISGEFLYSEEFNIGGQNWKLLLYPKGNVNEKGKNLSLFLVIPDSEKFSLKSKLNAKYKLRIKDQVNFKHIEQEVNILFSDTMRNSGCPILVSLSELYDKSKGFIVNDTIVIEAEIEMLFVIKKELYIKGVPLRPQRKGKRSVKMGSSFKPPCITL